MVMMRVIILVARTTLMITKELQKRDGLIINLNMMMMIMVMIMAKMMSIKIIFRTRMIMKEA